MYHSRKIYVNEIKLDYFSKRQKHMSKLVYHDKLESKEYIWECMLFSLRPVSKPFYFILRITIRLYSS